jgi:hypothetical protein
MNMSDMNIKKHDDDVTYEFKRQVIINDIPIKILSWKWAYYQIKVINVSSILLLIVAAILINQLKNEIKDAQIINDSLRDSLNTGQLIIQTNNEKIQILNNQITIINEAIYKINTTISSLSLSSHNLTNDYDVLIVKSNNISKQLDSIQISPTIIINYGDVTPVSPGARIIGSAIYKNNNYFNFDQGYITINKDGLYIINIMSVYAQSSPLTITPSNSLQVYISITVNTNPISTICQNNLYNYNYGYENIHCSSIFTFNNEDIISFNLQNNDILISNFYIMIQFIR